MGESTESKKNPARSTAMARVWMARRVWKESPSCCCGCGGKLEVNNNPKRQRFFLQGHDGRLHALLRRVQAGEASRQDIPLAARANLARIGFIQRDQQLRKVFLNPGQQENRRRKSQA
jgi:hypothetical protein